MRNRIVQELTAWFVQQLALGVKPWEKCWKDVLSMPNNFSTRNRYHGINVFILQAALQKYNYTTNFWLTFKQAQELGGKIKKGAKAVACFYFTLLEREVDNISATGEETESVKFPYYKLFYVFNLDQIEGIEYQQSDFIVNDSHTPHELAEELIKNSGAKIERGGRPCYFSVRDVINMPPPELFCDTDHYYAALLHELSHWTGHHSRLNRKLESHSRSSKEYAFEELIAEMGSAFLMADLGLKAKLQDHPSYVAGWLEILQGDSRKLISAANKADHILTYLQQFYSANVEASVA